MSNVTRAARRASQRDPCAPRVCRRLYGLDRHTPEICLHAFIHALPLILFAGVTSATALAGQYTLPLVSTYPIDLSAFDLSGRIRLDEATFPSTPCHVACLRRTRVPRVPNHAQDS